MSIHDLSELRNTCFFCSKSISSKKTQEHIIPDSLLGDLGIKEERLIGRGKFLYSRIKVPAHKNCNNTFGSTYETKVLNFLNDPEQLYEEIVSQEDVVPWDYEPEYDTVSIISTWLSKLYYGVFYNDMLKVNDAEYKKQCYELINTQNFQLLQQSYKHNYGFSLPSSLFAFMSKYDDFDFRTFLYPNVVLVKIRKLSLVLCIGDGCLTKAYLDSRALDSLREHISEMGNETPEFPSHAYFFGEVVSHRLCIPKAPTIISMDDNIINLSFATSIENPSDFYKIDKKTLDATRIEILHKLGFSINS